MKDSSHIDAIRAFDLHLSQDHLIQIEQNKYKGEQDGRRNLPAIADEIIPPHELQILANYQSKVEEVYGLVQQILHEVKDSQWQPTVTTLLNWSQPWVEQRIQEATQMRDRRIEESAENHIDRLKVLENAFSYSRAKRDIESVESRLNSVSNRLGRYELHHKISPFWAITIAVAIGILEIPLNNQVFAMFRDPNTTMTLLLSLSLVVVMPILAHISGRLFRQGSERTSNYFIATILTTGVIVLSYFAALLRTEAIKDAPTASTSFFFVLNVLFFSAAAMASFQAHDPSMSLNDAHLAVRRARRRYARILADFETQIRTETNRYQQEKEDSQREFSRAQEAAQNSLLDLHQKGHTATAIYNQILSLGQGLERTIQSYSHAVILCRREENLKFRTNHAQPKSWKAPLPTLKLPLQDISEIRWPGS